MTILQLCNKIPYPALDGGSMVMHQATQALLHQGCTVHLLAIDTPKRPWKPTDLSPEYRQQVHIDWVHIDTRPRWWPALCNLFTSLPYHVTRYIFTDFTHRLQALLQQTAPDIVQIESLYLIPYIPLIRAHSQAKIVLRAQNVEHAIWEKFTQNLPTSPKKYYLKQQTARLRRFEQTACQQVDGIIAITQVDAEMLQTYAPATPITTIPLGISLEKYPPLPTTPTPSRSLFHLASMDWYPNVEAVDWFLAEVWPIVHAQVPSLQLHLAGKHMPDRLLARHTHQNVYVTGAINEPLAYLHDKGALIVPLRSGSGIRVKILEAMALCKPVISTHIGAEGIACTHGKDILLADTPQALADAIVQYYHSSDGLAALAANGQSLVIEQYNQATLGKRFVDFYQVL